MSKFKIYLGALVFFPSIVFAYSPTTFAGLLYIVANLIYIVIPVLMSLAVAGFLWGVAMYIWKGSNSTEREKGRKFIFWGIIGLFVMVSFWGLVRILGDTFFPGGSSSNYNSGNLITPGGAGSSQSGNSYQTFSI